MISVTGPSQLRSKKLNRGIIMLMIIGGRAPTIIVKSINFKFFFFLISFDSLYFLNSMIIPVVKKPMNVNSNTGEIVPKDQPQ
jgi:hypothetical protein